MLLRIGNYAIALKVKRDGRALSMPDYTKRRIQMVDTQVRPSDVTKFPIIDALLHVPRELYVPSDRVEAAYVGENLVLSGDRVLLEPRTFGKMLDILNIQSTDMVLDVGCGYGYSSAVLARLAETVVAVESQDELAKDAEALLSEQDVHNVVVLNGALAAGAEQHGPYDVIILEGAVETIPDGLCAQLKDGGRIVAIFAEGSLGTVRVGHSVNGVINWRFAFNASAPVLEGFSHQQEFAL